MCLCGIRFVVVYQITGPRVCAYAEYNGLKKRVNGIKRKKKEVYDNKGKRVEGKDSKHKKRARVWPSDESYTPTVSISIFYELFTLFSS